MTNTVNQVCFAIYRIKNLIAATNYREQDVHYIDNTAQETFNNGFAVGNIRVNESLANLSKYFRK